ncbi:hypothetical protein FSP39_004448 [Pinctada imbricata]|uniref:Mab-21-like nucleotidyltransferase domain-containing protein n=1 Tax=Pinctada imbricata TaxID=66713 RepID=A0AA89BK75_PINIB|nr:hypothetical protein FSP39_004448 [Pinctada imbricata]
MAAATVCDNVSLISKGLYMAVSVEIGSESIVKIRRQKYEIHDLLGNCDSTEEHTHIQSGSRPEGFELGTSSDVDTVFVDRKAIVLTHSTITMARYYSKLSIPVLLMETEHASPGYTLVKIVTSMTNNVGLKKALVVKGKDTYVSSERIRESFNAISTSVCHGPCQTSTVLGLDRDHVYALHCPFWPKRAVNFIRRSLHIGWPSYDVLTDICKDGCLLVPINSKQQHYSDTLYLEWRISFSRAEKKLIGLIAISALSSVGDRKALTVGATRRRHCQQQSARYLKSKCVMFKDVR